MLSLKSSYELAKAIKWNKTALKKSLQKTTIVDNFLNIKDFDSAFPLKKKKI